MTVVLVKMEIELINCIALNKNEETIIQFDNDTLFRNIYYYYFIVQNLSRNCKWEKEAAKRLKNNIIFKWPKKDFGNVFVFLELLSRGFDEVNPVGYFDISEDYFEKLLKLDMLKNNTMWTSLFKKGNCIR